MHCEFYHNIADESVIYIDVPSDNKALPSSSVYLLYSHFMNNIGNCMYLSQSFLTIKGEVLFINNSADKGAALYFNKGSSVEFEDGADVCFIDNCAISNGGAVYVDLSYGCDENQTIFKQFPGTVKVSFNTTHCEYSSNSFYVSVSKYCGINANYKENSSIMYVP